MVLSRSKKNSRKRRDGEKRTWRNSGWCGRNGLTGLTRGVTRRTRAEYITQPHALERVCVRHARASTRRYRLPAAPVNSISWRGRHGDRGQTTREKLTRESSIFHYKFLEKRSKAIENCSVSEKGRKMDGKREREERKKDKGRGARTAVRLY